MWRIFAIFSVMMFSVPCLADDCLEYKIRPRIDIITPGWVKEVVQPIAPMDLLHGNVSATLVDNYDIVADITSIEDGFCVALKRVDATIGYSDFLVKIDMRHTPGTCSYDAILAHEDEHIRAYLSVIDDFQNELRDAVYSAADAVMPVFVYNGDDIDAAVDLLNDQIQSHPDVILVKQKIRAAEEIRNKRIDQHDTGAGLRQCFSD